MIRMYFAAITMLISSIALAADFEMNLGQSRYRMVGSGVWWDERFPHSLDIEAPAFSLGFTGDLTSGLDWRAGYLDLGKITTTSIGLSDDSPQHPERHHHTSRFVTDSHVTGLYASALTNGDLYIEVGLFIFKPDFRVTMYDLPVGYHANGDRFGSQDVVGVHDARWTVKTFVAAGFKYKRFKISAAHYSLDNKETDQYSTVYKNATTVMVGMMF